MEKQLFIGDFKPEDDGENTEGGILGNENKGDDDIMSRIFLALCVLAAIGFLYTQVLA